MKVLAPRGIACAECANDTKKSEGSGVAEAGQKESQHGIRAVVLDFGMVICNLPTNEHIARIATLFSVDTAGFWKIYDTNRLALDRGDISPDDYWRTFARNAGHSLDESTLKNLKWWDIEMWLGLNDAMLAWVERLHGAGYKLGLLSNLHQSFANHLREHAAWLRHFHVPVFSAEVGRVKPEPEIYRHLLEKLDTPAHATLFIDDRRTNIDAARHEGMQGLVFTSVEQLRSDLSAIHFQPLP
jgi:putative hydrolase of the HAD superfamily